MVCSYMRSQQAGYICVPIRHSHVKGSESIVLLQVDILGIALDDLLHTATQQGHSECKHDASDHITS